MFLVPITPSRKVAATIIMISFILMGCAPSAEEPSSSEDDVKTEKNETNQEIAKQETAGVNSTDEATKLASNEREKETNATVTRVIDGDTLEVSMNGQIEDVRLLLVDTPETVHPSEPVQPFGPEASQFVKENLSGEKVRVKVGQEERDHYGRLLAYVFIDGKTIQEMLLSEGLARTAYLYNDLTMLDEFHEAQKPARTSEIGVWSIPGYAHVDHSHGYHYQVEPEQGANTGLKYDPAGRDRDCGDFSSQQQAQEFFESAGGHASDPHRLDGDGNGLVCESL
ncbi:thermonuclease family protein [Halobacillus shinanisalinarum]|uniref:Thermonuclease family protein n=1 Tax=Halobacillus shinanisalinarum TaxID=2932258 RepID=A0ABY4GW78_9BACI|nr:thermonuclease family protein [Halobacillus shinanisalinarum]UOQ92211.1 thermonuclease family protein [Halobacillus shinanisalinarum]